MIISLLYAGMTTKELTRSVQIAESSICYLSIWSLTNRWVAYVLVVTRLERFNRSVQHIG